jgi:4,5-dihydroxyphthalate decarboxylase
VNIQRPAGTLSVAVAEPTLFGDVVSRYSSVDLDLQPKADYVDNLLRMSQDTTFDLFEMPLVSLLQGLDVGLPVRVLPVVMLRRTPHLYWLGRPSSGEPNLSDVVTGVRAYAQTTGVWLRAVLADQFGLTSTSWVTTDAERYAQFPPPSTVRRIPHERGLPGLLDDGLVQAIVAPAATLGSLEHMIDNAAGRAREWFAAARITPINHVLICSEAAAAEKGDELREVVDALRQHGLGDSGWADGDSGVADRPSAECFDRDQILRSTEYLMPHALSQGLLSGHIDFDAKFAV